MAAILSQPQWVKKPLSWWDPKYIPLLLCRITFVENVSMTTTIDVYIWQKQLGFAIYCLVFVYRCCYFRVWIRNKKTNILLLEMLLFYFHFGKNIWKTLFIYSPEYFVVRQGHWNGKVVVLMTYSSLAAAKVVILTNFFIKMMTFLFQCWRHGSTLWTTYEF